jgi:hypothetical protein
VIRLYQIFYSPETRQLLDPGFLPLDNLANERPDWREYWPIRTELTRRPPADDEYLAFLSPKFRQKTALSAAQVRAFVEENRADADVMLFSPFYDQSAFFSNPFEQAAGHHPGIYPLLRQCVALIAPQFDPDTALLHSRNAVFCNYFAASGRFWRRWLSASEILYARAENPADELGRALNEPVYYNKGSAPTKAFVIERLVSVLLAAEPTWRVRAYNPLLLPLANRRCAGMSTEIAVLDALKVAYQVQGYAHFRDAYFLLRQRFLEALS